MAPNRTLRRQRPFESCGPRLPERGAALETVYFTTDCSGVGGSRLRLLCDDDRSWVTVVTPDGQQFPLEFWNIVTPFFADHGLSVEWRVVRARGKPMPIAITVQLNAWQPNPNDVAAAAPAARGSEDHA